MIPHPHRHRAGLLTLLLGLAACRSRTAEPAPAVGVERPPVISAARWGSTPDPIPEEKRHTPVRITVHHAGVRWKEGDDPYRKLAGLQAWGRREKGWADVPYHFLVAPDGRIFEGRPTDYEGETNTEYDVTGHLLVQLWGDFEEQRVGVKQLRSAVRLVAWLCRRFRIPPRAIATHRGWSVQTSCPGRDLHRYFREGSFRRWVEETLRGGTPELRLGRPLPGGPTRPVPLPAPPRQPGSSERGERSRGKARHDHLPQGA